MQLSSSLVRIYVRLYVLRERIDRLSKLFSYRALCALYKFHNCTVNKNRNNKKNITAPVIGPRYYGTHFRRFLADKPAHPTGSDKYPGPGIHTATATILWC